MTAAIIVALVSGVAVGITLLVLREAHNRNYCSVCGAKYRWLERRVIFSGEAIEVCPNGHVLKLWETMMTFDGMDSKIIKTWRGDPAKQPEWVRGLLAQVKENPRGAG